MRALTVRQPWAWAIIHGGKGVENRSRNIAGGYRGTVAIHAGLTDDDSVQDYEHPMSGLVYAPCPDDRNLAHNGYTCSWCQQVEPRRYADRGRIIGVVDLVDVHVSKRSTSDSRRGKPVCFDDTTPTGHLCSPWAQPDRYHLILANPRPLPEPIPYRGRLGLWTLPDDVLTDPEPGEQPWCELPRCPRRADPGSVLCTEHQVGAGRRP